MTTPRQPSIRIAAALLGGAALSGLASAAFAGPPPAISVQIATPGFYTSFATGPQWVPYHVHAVAPVVPVYYAAPVYAPRYVAWGPPPGYWRSRQVDYRHSGWDHGWHGDDGHHHGDRPRHHRDDDRRGGRGHGDRH